MKPQICVSIEPPNLCKLTFSCTSKGVRFNCREQTSVYTYKYLWCMYLQLLFWLHQGLYKHSWLPSGGSHAACRETRSLPLLYCTIDVPSISMQGQDNNILFWKTCKGSGNLSKEGGYSSISSWGPCSATMDVWIEDNTCSTSEVSFGEKESSWHNIIAWLWWVVYWQIS